MGQRLCPEISENILCGDYVQINGERTSGPQAIYGCLYILYFQMSITKTKKYENISSRDYVQINGERTSGSQAIYGCLYILYFQKRSKKKIKKKIRKTKKKKRSEIKKIQ